MKRIYLDQWVWIELAKLVVGKTTDLALDSLLRLARSGVKSGLLSFPLSPTHYMELAHIGSGRQRRDVGMLMYELSRGHRMISPVEEYVAAEFDAALKRRYGVPTPPRQVRVFGVGTNFAFGQPPVRGRIVFSDGTEPQGDEAVKWTIFENWANDTLERAALCGPPDGVEVPDYEPHAHRVFADEFAATEEDQAARFLAAGADTTYQGRVLRAREWAALLPTTLAALQRAGIDADWFLSQGAQVLTEFIADMPVVHASLEMRRHQHQNPSRRWRANDAYDVTALSMAVVHCDAVVTEKHWADVLHRAHLDERHSTLVVDGKHLADLVTFLAAG